MSSKKYITSLSVQEIATKHANSLVGEVNNAIAQVAGIEIMWFRAKPDKKNQDVIFQSYTLWGVEDCPLTFKAVYTDTGYDDAAITYNIMGLEYSVPLTLEIAVNTWYTVTGQDGTLPQRGDIVFIPITNKLVEVVSMTPVKAIGGQVTSFKVNCSIYKPTRSRIVGENLKDTIDANTVNLDKLFGEDIQENIDNLVDDKELSLFSSTTRDKHKEVTKTDKDSFIPGSGKVSNIIDKDIMVDGHIVARSYYDMSISDNVVVTYKNINDSVTIDSTRCLSCWVNLKEAEGYKNVKNIEVLRQKDGTYLKVLTTKKCSVGENVVIERGNIIICGQVTSESPYIIKVNPRLIDSISKMIPNWNDIPGFIMRKDNVINLLSGGSDISLSIDIKANTYVSVALGASEILYQLTTKLKPNKWYGVVLNISGETSLDVYDSEPILKKVYSVSTKNKAWKDYNFNSYFIKSSESYLTNIRYYNVANKDTDRQIKDLLSYNIANDHNAIINDSANVWLDKNYFGQQR